VFLVICLQASSMAGFVGMERAMERASLPKPSVQKDPRQELLEARIQARTRSERLRETETRVVTWIEEVTSERRGEQSTAHWLSSGLVLCRLVNKIVPGLIKENQGASQSCMIENIRRFLQVAQSFGLHEDQLFEPFDIIKHRDMFKVVMAIRAFAEAVPRAVPQYCGPRLGQAMGGGSLCSSLVIALRTCFSAPPAPSVVPVQRYESESYTISERTFRGSQEVSLRFDSFAKAKSKQVEVAHVGDAMEDSGCDSTSAGTCCGSEDGQCLIDIEV